MNNQKRERKLKVCANPVCAKAFENPGSRYCSKGCILPRRRRYSAKAVLAIIKAANKKLGRVPAKREVREVTDIASDMFGSWNAAIEKAGLLPNRSHSQRMYKRANAIAQDGHLCDSISEAIVDNWLVNNGILHERHISYPGTHHKADWGIGKNIFLEYFGLAHDSPRYDRSVEEKRRLCKRNSIKLIEIYPKDLYPSIALGSKLKDFVVGKVH